MAKRKRRRFTPEFKALLLPISIGGEVRSVEFFLCGVVPVCYV